MSAVHDLKTGEQIDPVEAAYRRVKAQAEAAEAAAARFGGPCSACRWHRGGSGILDNRYCVNPLVVTVEFNRSTGGIVKRGQMLPGSWNAIMGPVGHPELCGDDRRLWEPRPTLWQRFLAWITGE